MLIVAVVVVRLVVANGHVSYVRPSFGILLLIAAVIVGVLGLILIWRSVGSQAHGHTPWIGSLVLIPMLTLVAVAPAPLGAFAASIKGTAQPIGRPAAEFGPLPAETNGAVPLAVGDFVSRAVYAPDSIEGVRVRLVGLVTPDASAPSGYLLTRFMAGCCAADAVPLQVAVVGDAARRNADAWLEVTGTFEPRPGDQDSPFTNAVPLLEAEDIRSVSQPPDPYEF